MIRRIVVFPLSEAPRRTKDSPSAFSKLMNSSTLILPKRYHTPQTLAAFFEFRLRVGFGGTTLMRATSALTISTTLYIKPVTGKKKNTENQKREESKHNGDCIGCLD